MGKIGEMRGHSPAVYAEYPGSAKTESHSASHLVINQSPLCSRPTSGHSYYLESRPRDENHIDGFVVD